MSAINLCRVPENGVPMKIWRKEKKVFLLRKFTLKTFTTNIYPGQFWLTEWNVVLEFLEKLWLTDRLTYEKNVTYRQTYLRKKCDLQTDLLTKKLWLTDRLTYEKSVTYRQTYGQSDS